MGKLPKIEKEEEKKEIPIGARFKGPGPAAYTIKSTICNECNYIKRAPAYSFGVKFQSSKADATPGPNQFSPIALRNGVHVAPAYSIVGRNFPSKKANASPGPASYYPNFLQSKNKSPPAFSLSGRYQHKVDVLNPSPASYSITSQIGSQTPAWTIHPLIKKKQYSDSPGPAKYDLVNMNYVRKSAPAYSLYFRKNEDDNIEDGSGNGGKTIKKRVRMDVPGPGAYNVNINPIKKSSPGFSFRNKHSEFELLVPESPEDLVINDC